MTIPTPEVTTTGVTAPTYAEVLDALKADYWSIYGSDARLDADTQDGQFLAVLAQALYDTGQTVVSVYNQMSPLTAQGAGLSSVVKINGIARLVPTNSTAIVTLTGQNGTVINNGQVGDNANLSTRWSLPAVVNIGVSGEVDVTATCTEEGDTTAAAGTLTVILTPTRGWQAVTNDDPATAGAPVETDADLRQRQTLSTALPDQTPLEGIYSALANLTGVTRLVIYENDSDITDGDGIPSHSISVVIEGGDLTEIVETVANKKAPGTGTYGTTSEVVIDANGVPNTINFFVLEVIQLDVKVDVTALAGWVITTADKIKAAVALYLSSLGVGEDSYTTRLYSPAGLNGDAATTANSMTQTQLDELSSTYVITAITQAETGDPLDPADVVVDFNQAAAALVINILVDIS